MPTSTAVDRVAEAPQISRYETPTGWKFFGNLMDAGDAQSVAKKFRHRFQSRAREGWLWAVLCWLSILATTSKSVGEVSRTIGRKFGAVIISDTTTKGWNNLRNTNDRGA